MFLTGFSIENFRSFGNAAQIFAPTTSMNIIIGKNNAGKSNVLRAINFLIPQLDKNSQQGRSNSTWNDDLDKSRFSDDSPRIGLLMQAPEITKYMRNPRKGSTIDTLTSRLVEKINSMRPGGIWSYKVRKEGKWDVVVDNSSEEICRAAFPGSSMLADATVHLTGGAETGGDRESYLHNCRRLFSLFDPFQFAYDSVLIPATRSVKFQTRTGSSIQNDIVYSGGVADLGGVGLIDRLFKFQNPTFSERRNTERFHALTEFVRAIVDNQSATIQVPYDKAEINLIVDNQVLPLASYGAGIEQIVVIAAAATMFENYIICLEEPETNLHPEYQTRLLDYLRDKTDNQYFITTHAHSVIDLDRATIFSVTLTKSGSNVRRLLDQSDHFQVVFDLGYRPSDIAQCNSVIWVEGPSDRIYLKAAIAREAPELIEGTDFSIMFYGGRLLSHLSADDSQIDEFIVLTQINRRSAILIDSDKKKTTDEINKTKTRVINEFKKRDLLAWVTEGREIENYIDAKKFLEIVNRIWPGRGTLKTGRYDDMCKLSSKSGKIERVDKVRVAHEVVAQIGPTGFRFDWNSKISELVEFIRTSK